MGNLKIAISQKIKKIFIKKISDNQKERYEIPYLLNYPNKTDGSNSTAKFEFFEDPVTKLTSFKIVRNSDGEVIFDTSFGGFIFTEQFIQISSKLSTEYIYGFGENNHESLKHDLGYKTWGIFARDNAPGWGVITLQLLCINFYNYII